jgi:hypothetical protein
VRRVFRTEIAVDDRWHTVPLRGPILHVATRGEDYVEIWHLEDSAVVQREGTFRVYGTGEVLVLNTGKHVGTAITPGRSLVWHLFERAA